MLKINDISINTQRALKNANWLLLEKAVSMPLSLAVSFVIARYLGPEQLGEYSYILAIVALVAPLSVMGLSGLVSRELISHPDNEASIMGTVLVGRLVGVFLTVVIIASLIFIIDFREPRWIVVIAIAQILSFCSVVDYWLQAKLLARMSVIVRLSVLFIMSSGKLLIVCKDLGLSTLVYLYALEFFLTAVGYCLAYIKKGGNVKLNYDGVYFRELLGQSKWLIFSGVAAVIYLKIDIVMLKHLVSESEVGIYSVASRISEIWYFIPTIIVTSFFPKLLEARKKSLKSYYEQLQKLNDYLLLFAIIIVFTVVLTASSLIHILYGQVYSSAAPIVQVHIFAGIFIFMRALLSKWLIMEHLLKYSLVTQASGAILNIILNFLFIPKYQGIGAAYSTLISYAVASYFALFLSKDTRPMAMVMTRSLFFPLRWSR